MCTCRSGCPSTLHVHKCIIGIKFYVCSISMTERWKRRCLPFSDVPCTDLNNTNGHDKQTNITNNQQNNNYAETFYPCKMSRIEGKCGSLATPQCDVKQRGDYIFTITCLCRVYYSVLDTPVTSAVFCEFQF